LLAAIVLAGLVAVSINGNATYFGVIRVIVPISSLLWPALLVAMACGLAGGLFARLLVQSLSAAGSGYFESLRRQQPIRFAAGCGLAVAVIGIASQGVTFGSGYAHTQALINGQTVASPLAGLLMAVSTWITTWSGVPGGIFAPSLTIGASLGQSVAQLTGSAGVPTLIALGMAGFLAAVTQAPLTAFIIVMEMVDGHALVLSLMASALVASGISRLISPPLYTELARLQLARIPPRPD
jgi:H+/Cl- antiporter ClcA